MKKRFYVFVSADGQVNEDCRVEEFDRLPTGEQVHKIRLDVAEHWGEDSETLTVHILADAAVYTPPTDKGIVSAI